MSILDRFKIDETDLVRIDEGVLREVTVRIFERMGVSRAGSERAADVLISADVRGMESHGVSNMLREYISDYQSGKLNPNPSWKVIRESPATASIDGDRGIGIIIAQYAMELAIEKAREVGIGMVTIKNSGHMGMVSYFPMMALQHNMIGMGMTSTIPEMIPTFGAEARLGTNPIAVAAPGEKEGPFVFDAATTVVANNTLGHARRLGVKLPAGWIADSEGTPILEDVDPPPKIRSRSGLLPLGSTPELGSHKGYGLGCIVEIMSGILTGGGFGAQLVGRGDYTHMVAAYNIAAFMDVDEFKQTMDAWLMTLRTTRPAKGQSRVLYPGQLEAEYAADRKEKGILLHHEVITWFETTCNELGIPCTLVVK